MRLIIDVKNALFRMGWAHINRPPMPNIGHVGPLYGFMEFLHKLSFRWPDCTSLVLTCDPVESNVVSWRRSVLPTYKVKDPRKNDKESELRHAVLAALPMIKQLAAGMPVQWLEDPNWEADDLIADYVRQNTDMRTSIVSQDRDMLQLCEYDHVTAQYPHQGNFLSFTKLGFSTAIDILYTKKNAKKPLISNMTPRAYVIMKCFAGDHSDNVAGLMGIAEKRAIDMLKEIADASGGMAFIPQHPVNAFQVFKKLVESDPGGGAKWRRNCLIDNPQAPDLLHQNYFLMNLLDPTRTVTYSQSFSAIFQEGWFKQYLQYYGFADFLNGSKSDQLMNWFNQMGTPHA